MNQSDVYLRFKFLKNNHREEFNPLCEVWHIYLRNIDSFNYYLDAGS
jgi:hypothetical protein